MSKAAELAALIGSQTALSNRNLIINGAMQVAQRGTSFTAGGYSLDHWYIAETGTCTVTQDTADVPSNFKYAMKTTTSAASSFIAIYQPFESVDYEAFKNKTVTISFYAKVNATFSGTMFVDMQTGDTADTLLSGTWAGNDPQYITPTTSWARYSVSIAIGSTNGIRFVLTPSAAQASGAEYSITGVQLEVGEQATPFEHRSYGDELARCQRYYEICDIMFNGYGVGGAYCTIPQKVTKRATPTATNGTSGAYTYNWTFSSISNTQNEMTINGTSSSGGYRVHRYDIAFDAEL